jgi:hypothetical protein
VPEAAPTSGADALLALYDALPVVEREVAYERISEKRLLAQQAEETELARHLRSLSRVAEVIGHTPDVREYRLVSKTLRANGEDVQSFARVFKFFRSWPQAREALELSSGGSTRAVEARLRNRKLGRIVRYPDDVLRDTLRRAVEHYKRPPSTAEFAWWRERQIELGRAQGDPHPNIPSENVYRRRWKTWEGALLDNGYTSDEVALRLLTRDQIYNPNPDAYLPDYLPIAELQEDATVAAPLTPVELQHVRECYEAMPRRTRYVLTARLGLAGEKLTLRETAEPLALHVSRIQQLQLYALDALLHAASEGRKKPRHGLRKDIVIALQRLSELEQPE